MNGHHLVLGKLQDYITGDILLDTDDERCRQAIARLLVNRKGFRRDEIQPRVNLLVQAGGKKAIIKIDYALRISERIGMLVNFGPGSIVTRRRPLLAASRTLTSYQIPTVVATNGLDAEILDGISGKVISRGLESIPDREQLLKIVAEARFSRIPAKVAEMESRILYCYEVDGACPCDEDVCRL